MTDAEYEATRARIEVLWAKWLEPLGLESWRITNVWHRELLEHRETAAQTTTQWPYLRAGIEWVLPLLVDEDDRELEFIFLHEVMHIVLKEMREDEGSDEVHHEERVATVLAQAFRATWDTASPAPEPAPNPTAAPAPAPTLLPA